MPKPIRSRNRIFRRILCGASKNILHISDNLVMGIGRVYRRLSFPVLNAVSRNIGDVGHLIGTLPPLQVWRLNNSGRDIIFVGTMKSLPEIKMLLYGEYVPQERLADVALWNLDEEIRNWLNDGTELVVCQLSRLYHPQPGTSINFAIPVWVNQLIHYPDDFDHLLRGRGPSNIRRQLNKCRKSGFSYRFSRSKADFDDFYHRMYLPFVKKRHTERAFIAPYPLQWDYWIKRGGGGLLQVIKDGKAVAGAICYVHKGICHNIEIGILDSDPALLKLGVNTFLFWAVADWGHSVGAVSYNMGASRSWCSNGAFDWKAEWGAHVVQRPRACPRWSFYANRLSTPLREQINRAGLISEINGKHYSVMVGDSTGELESSELNTRLAAARKRHLEGFAVVIPDAETAVYDSVV